MKKKIILLIIVVMVIAAFAVYQYIYKEHRNIASEEIAYAIPAALLLKHFQENDSLANANYADETISVAGRITSVDTSDNSIMIDEKLSVIFQREPKVNLHPGQSIKVKGRFVGYDDLLEELKMDQAILIN